MRFSALIFASFVGALLAPSGRAVAASEANPIPPEEEVAASSVSEGEPHVVPVVWTFELDEDVVETPELVAEIQEAFILSANEAYSQTDLDFGTVDITMVMHEEIDSSEDDEMMLGDTDEDLEEEGDEDADDEGDVMGALRGIADGTLGRYRRRKRKKWTPPSYDQYRNSYVANTHIHCKFCGPGRMMSSTTGTGITPTLFHDLDLDLQRGYAARKRWQKGFCGKLRRIKALKKPKRCFIFMDLDHMDYPGGVADQPSLFLPVSDN
jgi:hypothetical protein